MPDATRQAAAVKCQAQGVRGSILLAAEGINGTIAGSRQAVDAVLAYLRQVPALASLTHKESEADFMPFPRLKVRLKQEIVKLGRPDITPNKRVGQYVPASEWNDLISDPDVILGLSLNGYFQWSRVSIMKQILKE